MVTRITFDLDDATRRLLAQQIDQEKGKHTRGRRLATRAEISQYVADQFGEHVQHLLTEQPS